MQYNMIENEKTKIAEITFLDENISSASDFLDIIANVPARRIVLYKKMVDDSFFFFFSGLAGEILQKVSNYQIRLAIIGDFSIYSSKSLKDFIYESNKTGQVIFVDSLESALRQFSG